MESHTNGMVAGSFSIRKGDWKLIHYVGYGHMLFNLKDDPEEMENLHNRKNTYKSAGNAFDELQGILYGVCSPEGVDSQARRDQQLLKRQLSDSGQLTFEVEKRGDEKDTQWRIIDTGRSRCEGRPS